MYLYFSRLYEKYRCRILPIAIFSHGAAREEETTFQVAFPFKQVLTFSFLKVEVHKQKWREYIRRDNPVAAALLSQMNIRPEERVEVKKEFLRMLVRLQLDPARMQLITGFFESYLILSKEEELTLRQEIEGLDRQEAEQIFRIETSWERRGREAGRIEGKLEGKHEGKLEVAGKLLTIGMEIEVIAEVTGLTIEEINRLKRSE